MSADAILITGGSGFVGSSVIHALRAMVPGFRLIAAGRNSSVADVSDVEYLSLDFVTPLPELPPGIDTVLHMAGEKRDESRMQSVNHEGTRYLAESAARAGVRRFLYVSSVGVYGATQNSGVITEASLHRPNNPYEISKDDGETCVREVCARTGMECVILQPSNVIGTVKGLSYPLLGLMKSVKRGNFVWFGRTEPWANYVTVEDTATAIGLAVQRAPCGKTYIINTPARLVDIVAWIAQELDVQMPQCRLPTWIGQTAATLGSAFARITGYATPIDRDRLIALTNSTRYDPSSFMKGMKFEYPLGIEAGIRGLARTYRRDGLL